MSTACKGLADQAVSRPGPVGRRAIPWRVYAALLVASVLWASLYTAGKPAVAATGAIQVTLCRVLLAFACLGLLSVVRGGVRLLREHLRMHWRAIVVLGLLNFGVSQMLALSALNFLPASVNGVLNNTHPLWVAIGTAVVYPPRRPVTLVVGSLVAVTGVGLVFLPNLSSELSAGMATLSMLGVVLSLGGSLVIASGAIIGRRVMPSSDPIALSALASGAAIIPMMLLTMLNGGFSPILEAPATTRLLLLYLGVGCTATNFALWYYGLKYLPAAAASAFQYLIAPVAVVLAAMFLGEPLTATLLLGTVCIVIGLVTTQIALAPGLLRQR